MADPDGIATPINAVVVCDLLAGRNRPQGNYLTNAIDGFHVRVGVARVIDVPLRNLHEDDFSSMEIVAMTGVFSGAEWTLPIDYCRIIDFEHGIAPTNRVRSKHPGTLNARMSDFHAAQ